MPTPQQHAILSPSSAHRWLICTAAPRFEMQFPRKEASVFAKAGTLAHSICEAYAAKKFCGMNTRSFNAKLKALKQDPLFDEGMLHSAEVYVQYLTERSMRFPEAPYVALETRVDLSRWVPESFGSCDCVMIGGSQLHITDYKNGVGEKVYSKENPQMRLYALGALEKYRMLYDIKTVSMAIVQPNITEEVTEDELTVDELLSWGDLVKITARKAFDGPGEFVPGMPQCRWCAANATCPARAEAETKLKESRDAGLIPSKAEPPEDPEARKVLGLPRVLTPVEIGLALSRAEDYEAWIADLRAYALSAILGGEQIPGYKVVASASKRAFRDPDAALEVILSSGVDEKDCYTTKPKTLAELEKLLGKKRFGELVGDLIIRPQGKPTLVDFTDPRPDYTSAESDFAGVTA